MINNVKYPSSYLFSELSINNTTAFGPNSENEFQITTVLNTIQPKKVFAVTSGILFFSIYGDDPDKINILLRPSNNVGIGLKIKYFVYRGVKSEGVLEEINGEIKVVGRNDTTLIDFLNKVWDEYVEFNNTEDEFTADKIGYLTSNDSVTDILKKFFISENYNLLHVEAGTHIGNFIGDLGFEIVLDDGDFSQSISDTGLEFDESFARATECILKANGDHPTDSFIFGGNKNSLSAKVFRQSIYKFIDPAAFYGAHITNNGKKNNGTIGTMTKKYVKQNEIYNDIISKFINKNKIYFYIRSNRGRSYNFYPPAEPTDKPIEFLDIDNENYELQEYSWPIRIFNQLNLPYIDIKLNIFSKGCCLFRYGGMQNDKLFYDENKIKNIKGIYSNLPVYYSEGEISMAYFVYFVFNNNEEVFPNEIFGPVNLNAILEKEDFSSKQGSYISNLRPALIQENGNTALYNSLIVLDGAYIADTNPEGTPTEQELAANLRTYILFPTLSNKEKDGSINKRKISAGYYEGINNSEEYCTKIYGNGTIYKGLINDGQDISSIHYRGDEDNKDMPVFQLGISEREYRQLTQDIQNDFPKATNYFFYLEEVSTTSLSFLKYNLKIQFDKEDGTKIETTASVSLYTIDGYFYFTKDYANNINSEYYKTFPNISAEFFPREDYNGEFGFDWLRKGKIDQNNGIIDKPFNKIIADHYKSDGITLEDNVNEYKGIYKLNRSKYFKLKYNEYKAIPVSWKLTGSGAGENTDEFEKDIGVSYVNFYRGITGANNQRAKLRLCIRANANSNPSILYIKYNKGLFIIRRTDNSNNPDNNPLDPTGKYRLLELKGNNDLPNSNNEKYIDIEIQNIADITADEKITVHVDSAEGEICGTLIARKNDDRQTKKVVVVRLEDNLPINTTTLGKQEANMVVNTMAIEKFLNHANINIEIVSTIKIDITGNTALADYLSSPAAPYSLLDPDNPTHNNENLENPFKIDMEMDDLGDVILDDVIQPYLLSISDDINNYLNHFFLVLTDREPVTLPGATTRLNAFRYKNELMISKKADDNIITHEFVHGFEVEHIFSNNGKYTYMHGNYSSINSDFELNNNPTGVPTNNITDNLMDYFITRKTLYKWQWDLIKENIKKIR
ncbi:MAG TPA: hypothetical protein VL022_09635 [Moheibacter sp.]|nr:hypothetical protein [Moheibacter sp.]